MRPDSLGRGSGSILLVTGAGLLVGLGTYAAWLVTGSVAWIGWYFQWPWIVLMVGLAALESGLAFTVRRAFLPDEPLYRAWTLIAFSAACDFLGAVLGQWMSSQSVLNPLTHSSWWRQEQAIEIRQFGILVGGTLRYALLAAGLGCVLLIYRKAGFLGAPGCHRLSHASHSAWVCVQ